MMQLRWTRTILCALGFVWVMVQWQQHDRRATAEQTHVAQLIARMCATPADTTDPVTAYRRKYLPRADTTDPFTPYERDDLRGAAERAAQKRRDGCEIGLRATALGSGVRVSGSVDVGGSVDVQ